MLNNILFIILILFNLILFKDERLLKHHKAIDFANKTLFVSPTFALNNKNEKLESLVFYLV
jgi:hypothetical protein